MFSGMLTVDGRLFDLNAPKARDIDFAVIATALSHQCRYNGHVVAFYSVAEHSALLSDYFRLRDKPLQAKWAHVHDAAEAYVGDLIRPLKRSLPAFADAEAKVAAAIYDRLGLVGPMPDEVIEADRRIIADEVARFVPASTWKPEGPPLGLRPYGMLPQAARHLWWNRGRDLFGAAWK